MLKNYLKTTLRNLLRNKVFSLINLLGLTIGMTVCLLILQYIQNEQSYDQFYPQKDRLFRVVRLAGAPENHSAQTSPALAPLMQQTFPEIADIARIHRSKGVVNINQNNGGKKAFRENKIYFADQNFLALMGYPMRTQGEPNQFLKNPNTVVISQKTAARYFGGGNPVGESLVLNDYNFGKKVLTVTGVFKNIPANAHLQFDMLFSLASIRNSQQSWAKFDNWGWTNFYTFVKLKPEATAASLQAKFPPLVKRMLQTLGEDSKLKLSYELQNIKQIHLHSQLKDEPGVNGNILLVRFLSILSLFVLILAWVNYINLSTARSLERAKEVGIRKVVGAYRSQLIIQFLLEALLLNLVALGLAILVVDLTYPWFSNISGQSFQVSLWSNPKFVMLFAGFFLLGTLLSGAYPAFALSRFNPVTVLKGKFTNTARGTRLRKSLVVIQFAVSIVLIIGTFAVYQQLRFMQNKDLGTNLDQMLVINGPELKDSLYVRKADLFRQALLKKTSVTQVAYSSSIPSKSFNWASDGFKRNTQDKPQEYVVSYIDQYFVKTYQMKLLAGTIPSNLKPYYRRKGAIINETACKQLGFASPDEAVNQLIHWDKQKIQILGVLQDYHHYSLKQQVSPTVMFFQPEGKFCSIKIQSASVESGNAKATYRQLIAYAKKQYETFFPGNPFGYFFAGEVFNRQYRSDQQFSRVFALFSALAIFIACLGLFGLSLFTTQQKNKEIGIRKVLGASAYQILYLLSRGFIRLVLIAYLIGLPITYWAISQWLRSYAYKISIHLGLFLIPAITVLVLACLTIAYQTLKAVKANPVDVLRYE